MSIAERRHHRDRLKKARRMHWGQDLLNNAKSLSMAVDTPHPCSCPSCGNQRSVIGKSIQEMRNEGN